MAGPRAIGALRDVFRAIDNQVAPADHNEDDPDPELLFESITEDSDGEVAPISLPTAHHDPVQELHDWSDPWPLSYGIDASTTRPLTFSNGLLLGSANAKLGLSGTGTADAELKRETTLTTVLYHESSDIDTSALDPGYDGVRTEVFQFPSIGDRNRNLPRWITGIARTHAEGLHARRLIDRVDGPLFLDGRLYPSQVLLWTMFAQASVDKPTPMDFWPTMIERVALLLRDSVVFDSIW